MDDSTKIKLINSLIDVVERFYELKNRGETSQSRHVKGFCEGLAYALTESKQLSQEEASKILKGLGKKQLPKKPLKDHEIVYKPNTDDDTLDIPTFMRKK